MLNRNSRATRRSRSSRIDLAAIEETGDQIANVTIGQRLRDLGHLR
jgi:hypothetical protein